MRSVLTGFSMTPESEAAKLEQLVGRPELRERIEIKVNSLLQDAEVSARFGAVVLRTIRDKKLWHAAGWPSWEAFAGYFAPDDPHRFDLMVEALEILNARGDTRDFKASDVAEIVASAADRSRAAAAATTGEVLPADGSVNPGNAAQFAHHTQTAKAEQQGISRRTQQKLDAIARARPDLLEEIREGFMSVHAAAIEAGVVKPRDRLRSMVRDWEAATPDERDVFEAYIAAWRERHGFGGREAA